MILKLGTVVIFVKIRSISKTVIREVSFEIFGFFAMRIFFSFCLSIVDRLVFLKTLSIISESTPWNIDCPTSKGLTVLFIATTE